MREKDAANSFLRGLLQDIKELKNDIEDQTSDLSDAEMQRQPAPQSWSILSCIGHLNRTGSEYLPRLSQAASISPKIDNGDSLPYRPSWIGRVFLSNLSPSSGRRWPAPRKFRPLPTTDCLATKSEFNAQLNQLADLIGQVDGKNFNVVRFSSPLSPLIRFTLADGMAVVVTHARRHMIQITKTREIILKLEA
ncbi:MAG: DinB family protein [Bacteroidetes bacterium]|nr:DinB family protein [Bacteroidota bacterium]